MSTIELGMRDDTPGEGDGEDEDGGREMTSSLLAAATAPVRRWPERRLVVLGSACALFAAIFVTRQIVSTTNDALSLIYVVPAALVALELGMWAGLAAAFAGIAAVVVWMLTKDSHLDAVALIVRSAIFLTVALIAGRFSDRMRQHSVREQRLLRSGLDLARLEETGSVAALLAEHVQEAVRAACVRVELAGSPAVRLGRPPTRRDPTDPTDPTDSDRSLRVPIVSRERRLGTLEAWSGQQRSFTPEDRLMLETLALQAAVASENQRLLVVEREQSALRAELERLRRRLDEQLQNAARVLEHHEQERRGIARQLHEEAAQTMAAALMTVGMLERGPQRDLTRSHLEEVRTQVRASISDLRRIAGGLRPSVLDELGLACALERIAELEAERGRRSVTFTTGDGGVPPRLEREVETSAYRVIEESLHALHDASSIDVAISTRQERMEIVIDARFADGRRPATGENGHSLRSDLVATRARMELIGGSMHIGALEDGGMRLVAELPLSG